MKAYVVCKNDFPFEVWFDETKAEERKVELQREADKNHSRYRPKVYVHIKEVPAFQ